MKSTQLIIGTVAAKPVALYEPAPEVAYLVGHTYSFDRVVSARTGEETLVCSTYERTYAPAEFAGLFTEV